MCRHFSVSRQGYYDWLKRLPSRREKANIALDGKINAIFEAHKGRYGAVRVTHELKSRGETVSVNRVAKRMKKLGLKSKHTKKFKATTDSQHALPVYSNQLMQNFMMRRKNEAWVSDITAIRTHDGWLYLCVFIDLFNREIIGWSMSHRMKKALVCDALLMALWRRHFPVNVIVHSDQGSQYCSKRYRQILADNQFQGSMSAKGCCYDNAVAESFFHSLKVECIYGEPLTTRENARRIVFEYIESYYNRNRRHSALGYVSPVDFDKAS